MRENLVGNLPITPLFPEDGFDKKYFDLNFENYLEQLRGSFDLAGDIALIHCPTFSFEAFSRDVALKKGYYAYPPIGLQCLKAALKGELGLTTYILDLNFEILERIQNSDDDKPILLDELLIEILEDFFRDKVVSIVGVSAGIIVSNIYGVKNHPFLQVLNYLQQKHEQVVISGGVIATNEWKSLLLKGLTHLVFKGESEDQLTFFIKKLLYRESDQSFSGINFKLNGEIHETLGNQSIVNFDWDLVETYNDIPIERYQEIGSLSPFSRMLGTDRPYSTIQLNRGCRANCSFCGVIPFMGKGVRSYPVESVVSEVIYLARDRKIQHLEWLDDDLLRYRDTLMEVLQRIKEENLNLTWAANNGLIAAAVDEEILQVMIESGCVGFRIGVESGNEQMLRQIRKPATKKTLRDSSLMFDKFPDLIVVGCYIIGFEDETYQQLLDTFQFSVELNLEWSGFSICQEIRDSTDITEEFENDYADILDFVPTKANAEGLIPNALTFDIRKLFDGKSADVHEKQYLDEMWFAFNLLSNYVNNKNLRRNGRPELFVRWVLALQLSHPSNAVISLFLSLGGTLVDDHELAEEQWEYTETLLADSSYWTSRFQQYSLNIITDNRPLDKESVYAQLDTIIDEYKSLMFG